MTSSSGPSGPQAPSGPAAFMNRPESLVAVVALVTFGLATVAVQRGRVVKASTQAIVENLESTNTDSHPCSMRPWPG